MTGGAGFDATLRVDTELAEKEGRHVEEVLIDQIIEWIDAAARPLLRLRAHSRAGTGRTSRIRSRSSSSPCDGHDHSFNQGDYGQLVGQHGQGLTLNDAEANHRMFFPPDLSESDRRHMIAHYDAKLRFGDALIERLIEHLRATGRLDRTIVVVTADHGESFGEHGYRQHGPRVDEPAMRVPLVVWVPPTHPEHHPGGRSDELVRIVDIFPTLLDAARSAGPGGPRWRQPAAGDPWPAPARPSGPTERAAATTSASIRSASFPVSRASIG